MNGLRTCRPFTFALAMMVMVGVVAAADAPAPARQPTSARAGDAADFAKLPAEERHKGADDRWLQSQRTQRTYQRSRLGGLTVSRTYRSVEDLVRLRIVNGRMRAELADVDSFTPERVAIEGMQGLWTLARVRTFIGNGVAAANPPASIITVSRFDLDAPDDEVWSARLTANDRSLSLTAQSVYANYVLSQSHTGTLLRVTEWGAWGQPPREIFGARAESVMRLRAEHPAEFRLYALPLLARFGDPAFLRPGAADVYAAFDAIGADEAVTRQLIELLPALDADDPAEREEASTRLRQLGPAGVLAAMRVDESNLSDEQRSRLRAFVASARRRPNVNAEAARRDLAYLIDCLEYDDVIVRAAAKAELARQTGHDITFDPAQSGAAAAGAIDVLRQQLLGTSTTRPVEAPATRASPQS